MDMNTMLSLLIAIIALNLLTAMVTGVYLLALIQVLQFVLVLVSVLLECLPGDKEVIKRRRRSRERLEELEQAMRRLEIIIGDALSVVCVVCVMLLLTCLVVKYLDHERIESNWDLEPEWDGHHHRAISFSRYNIYIDECATATVTDNCHNDATCTITDGSFTCSCDAGWGGCTCNPEQLENLQITFRCHPVSA
ncbi:PREDICTED: uncharacterized protein LOC109481560 isoform X2 [Branchiostoma belcheri]|uniref:Uncharacterized protein LOC109481560 isoform X2 n=1 Tax=Branchiostoma belcheri TaxID=7741 RepID=A0A6P5A8R6_BRABE|nr:PREDICTED: uncharacterized protein LOC109481560 isoform X2 [Branchiostoma belcheri]